MFILQPSVSCGIDVVPTPSPAVPFKELYVPAPGSELQISLRKQFTEGPYSQQKRSHQGGLSQRSL